MKLLANEVSKNLLELRRNFLEAVSGTGQENEPLRFERPLEDQLRALRRKHLVVFSMNEQEWPRRDAVSAACPVTLTCQCDDTGHQGRCRASLDGHGPAERVSDDNCLLYSTLSQKFQANQGILDGPSEIGRESIADPQ